MGGGRLMIGLLMALICWFVKEGVELGQGQTVSSTNKTKQVSMAGGVRGAPRELPWAKGVC